MCLELSGVAGHQFSRIWLFVLGQTQALWQSGPSICAGKGRKCTDERKGQAQTELSVKTMMKLGHDEVLRTGK